jgi:diguanylate cyclase (GGDEF)-like protein
MESPLSDMLCNHVTETTPLPLPCSCIPMLAHGELLGVLHIRYSVPPGKETQIPDRKQLAITVAEQLALLLANLNLRETLRNQSIRDGLTGLFNRRYMEEAMTRELRRAERANRPLAVAILDLDHFKRFNDTFGHAAGDVALRAVSDVLKTKMRAGDIVCRYGGEEFVIIFIEMTLPNALSRMEGLRINIRQLEIEYLGTPLGQLTMSSGISAYPEYGNTPEALLKAADDALYRAKQSGRDRVVVIPLDPENPESEENAH